MKIIILLIFCHFAGIAYSQFRIETVGSPTSNSLVSTYTGWVNQGLLTFQGTAEVHYFQPKVTNGGFVFFSGIGSTFLDISGFSFSYADRLEIDFSVTCSDLTTSNDLKVELTCDGNNWITLPYDSLQYPGVWEGRMPAIDTSVTISNMHIRFTNTSTKQFSIDNIMVYASGLLPLKLKYFSSSINKKAVILHWAANSLGTKESFVIQKSLDGNYFKSINTINAKGYGSHEYSFTDSFIVTKPSCYRLQLNNDDGSFSYSDILYIRPGNNIGSMIESVSPIPARDKLDIQLNATKAAKASIVITGVSGKQYINNNMSLTTGSNHIFINVKTLPSGTYFLKINTPENTETRKIMIQH